MIFCVNPFATAVSVPKSCRLSPFLPTFEIDQPTLMKDYPEMTGTKSGLVIGAGAGPWPFLNRNAEMMPNLFVKEDKSLVQARKLYKEVMILTPLDFTQLLPNQI